MSAMSRALVLTAVVVTAGCDAGTHPSRTDPSGEHLAFVRGSDANVDTAAADAYLREGDFLVLLDSGGIQVRANRALRSAVLQELATRTEIEHRGFDTVAGEFTGWFSAPTPEQAVGLLATGSAYQASFEPGATGPRLVRIELLPAESHADQAAGQFSSGSLAAPDGIDPALAFPEPGPQASRLYDQWQEDEEYAADLLQSPDAEDRVRALQEFHAEGGGLVALDRALRTEADPAVRIALLRKLDESGSVVALQSILQGLSDREPEVVVTAVRLAQEWRDEELVERYLQPLLNHPDARVQAAVTDAIDAVRQ